MSKLLKTKNIFILWRVLNRDCWKTAEKVMSKIHSSFVHYDGMLVIPTIEFNLSGQKWFSVGFKSIFSNTYTTFLPGKKKNI